MNDLRSGRRVCSVTAMVAIRTGDDDGGRFFLTARVVFVKVGASRIAASDPEQPRGSRFSPLSPFSRFFATFFCRVLATVVVRREPDPRRVSLAPQ
jgi:hypothetical protein